MPDQPMTAGGLPIVAAEPVPGREPVLVRGDWVRGLSKRGEYAVLETVSATVMLDLGAVKRAWMALGQEIPR